MSTGRYGLFVFTPSLLYNAFQKRLFSPVIADVLLKKATCPAVPVPVTGLVKAFCLLLNAVQSALLKAHLFVADAVGRLKVCVSVAELIAKSVPLVPVAKYCTCAVKPLSAFNPVEKVVSTSQK